MARKKDQEMLRCSFCGKDQNSVKKLIAGPSVFICNECIDLCNGIIIGETERETLADLRKTLVPPRVIKESLDEYIIGQDEAKRKLAVAVYNHYKRIASRGIGGSSSPASATRRSTTRDQRRSPRSGRSRPSSSRSR